MVQPNYDVIAVQPMEPQKNDLPLIGWREWVKLPGLDCKGIKVKVDTGARTSAIHAFNIQELDKDGQVWVSFDIHPDQKSDKRVISTQAEVLEYREVRNSGGKATLRPVIVTPVTLRGQTWPIELTLANRDDMGFRMLLGRQAIRDRFLVDSGGSYYGGKRRLKRRLKKKKSKGKPPTA